MADTEKLFKEILQLKDEVHYLTTHVYDYIQAIKKLRKAIALCKEWVKQEPDSAIAFDTWGYLLSSLAHYYDEYTTIWHKKKKDTLPLVKEAITKYETAIKLDPNFGEAYMSLSSLYRKIGEDKKAEHYREAGVKLTVKGVRHISLK